MNENNTNTDNDEFIESNEEDKDSLEFPLWITDLGLKKDDVSVALYPVILKAYLSGLKDGIDEGVNIMRSLSPS